MTQHNQLHAEAIQHSLRVVSNPQYADTPQKRTLAWAVLKTARGQTISFSRLALGAKAVPARTIQSPNPTTSGQTGVS